MALVSMSSSCAVRPQASWASLPVFSPGLHQPARLIIGGYRLSRRRRLSEVLLGRKTKKGLRYLGTARAFGGTHLRKQLLSHLRMLHIHECPFLRSFETIPEGMSEGQMEDCIWVESSTRVWVVSGPLCANGLPAMAILEQAD